MCDPSPNPMISEVMVMVCDARACAASFRTVGEAALSGGVNAREIGAARREPQERRGRRPTRNGSAGGPPETPPAPLVAHPSAGHLELPARRSGPIGPGGEPHGRGPEPRTRPQRATQVPFLTPEIKHPWNFRWSFGADGGTKNCSERGRAKPEHKRPQMVRR